MLCRNKGSDMLFKCNWQLWAWRRCSFGLRPGPCHWPSSTSLLLFSDCNWAGSGRLPGLHSEVMRVCISVCICLCICVRGCWEMKKGEFTSRAKEQRMRVDSCTPFHPLRSAFHLLVYFLFVIRLGTSMQWDCCTLEDPALINNSKHRGALAQGLHGPERSLTGTSVFKTWFTVSFGVYVSIKTIKNEKLLYLRICFEYTSGQTVSTVTHESSTFLVWTLAELLVALWQAHSECSPLPSISSPPPAQFTSRSATHTPTHKHSGLESKKRSHSFSSWTRKATNTLRSESDSRWRLAASHIHRQMQNKWLYIPDTLCNRSCSWAPS